MIELNNISKRYKNNIALDNVSLQLGKNKILGILGQNGAGKTTLMDIICGCKVPDSGTVSINGFELSKSPEAYKNQISYMPEQVPLYKEMTVLEYLHFVADLRKIIKNDIEAHINEVLNLCGILHVKNRLIGNLSKGYRQRVGIAQALIGNANVLVLDEPTVGLDPKQVSELLCLIKKLGKDHTILISTHRIYEIESICDEYIILHKGVIKHRANIVEQDKTRCKIELLIDVDEIDILDKLHKLSFINTINKINTLKLANIELIRVIIECEGESFPEKAINTIFGYSGYCIYGIQRVGEDIEKIFLDLTKEQ